MPKIAEFKSKRVSRLAMIFQRQIFSVLDSPSLAIQTKIMAPTLVGAVVFHFLQRPMLGKIFNASSDYAFYEQCAEKIANLFLHRWGEG